MQQARMKRLQIRKTIHYAVVLFCFSLASCAAPRSQDTQQKLILGEEALTGGNYDAAVAYFSEYLKKSPQDGEAHLQLGLALLKKGSLREAITEFKQSTTLIPNNAEAFNLIKKNIMEEVTVFLNAGKNDVAMRYLTAHLSINPNDVDTHLMLTKEFIKMGSVRNAMQSLNRAAALDPKNPEVTELLDLFTQGFH